MNKNYYQYFFHKLITVRHSGVKLRKRVEISIRNSKQFCSRQKINCLVVGMPFECE